MGCIANEEKKRRENEFRGELAQLKHIEWLQNNIDKYQMGSWTELKKQLQEEITFDNYDAMKKRYMDFIYHFENNPYAYSFPVEGNREKIVSEYPECYFVLIEVEDREGKRGEYVSIGFLKKCIREIQTEIREDDWKKLSSCIERFLEKEKKMFWIHTYSKVERVYLKNFYESYKEEWESRDCSKNQEGNAEYLKKKKGFIVVMLCIIGLYAVSFLVMGIPFMDYVNELILLCLVPVIVEISIFIFSCFAQYKSGIYREAIEEYKKDDKYMYDQCCKEVNSKFLLCENEPLCMMAAKDYLSCLEKKLRMKTDNGMPGKKESCIIFGADLLVLLFFWFGILQ